MSYPYVSSPISLVLFVTWPGHVLVCSYIIRTSTSIQYNFNASLVSSLHAVCHMWGYSDLTLLPLLYSILRILLPAKPEDQRLCSENEPAHGRALIRTIAGSVSKKSFLHWTFPFLYLPPFLTYAAVNPALKLQNIPVFLLFVRLGVKNGAFAQQPQVLSLLH